MIIDFSAAPTTTGDQFIAFPDWAFAAPGRQGQVTEQVQVTGFGGANSVAIEGSADSQE